MENDKRRKTLKGGLYVLYLPCCEAPSPMPPTVPPIKVARGARLAAPLAPPRAVAAAERGRAVHPDADAVPVAVPAGGLLPASGRLHQVLPLRRPIEDAALLSDLLLQGWMRGEIIDTGNTSKINLSKKFVFL